MLFNFSPFKFVYSHIIVLINSSSSSAPIGVIVTKVFFELSVEFEFCNAIKCLLILKVTSFVVTYIKYFKIEPPMSKFKF